MIRTAIALSALVVLAATPAPQPSPQSTPQTAAEVLSHVGEKWRSLSTYQVPVTVRGNVRVSFFSVPVAMDGTEYFKAPDKEAMHLNNVPSLAKSFSNTISNMGTPQTWEATYDLSLTGTAMRGKHLAYVLTGPPRRTGNVKTVTMWVTVKTYSIDEVSFTYNNGSKLDLTVRHHSTEPHHLPTSIGVDAHFPGYSGHADITYGTYQVNVPIADSVFAQQ